MTLCIFTGGHCCCQPDEGTPCPDIPRFHWDQDSDDSTGWMVGPVPEGEWLRWSDVQRAILDPVKRCAEAERAAGVPGVHRG